MKLDSQAGPPGPSLIDSLRYLTRLKTGDMRLYEKLFAEYGDVVRLRCPGHEDVVFAFHPDDIHHVLCRNFRNYPKGKRYHELIPVLGMGLVNSDGELWRRQRRLVQEQFNHENTLQFVPLIGRHIDALLARWDHLESPFVRDLNDDMLDVTFGVAGEAFFGVGLAEHADTVRESFKFALSMALRRMNTLRPLPLSVPLPSHVRFSRAMAKIHDVIDAIITEYRTESRPANNVLQRLMNVVDPDTGNSMSHEQLRDEIKTILMVGHETSSVTATWALFLLARSPTARARLCREIDGVLAGRAPEVADFERMPFLNQVFNECLRLLPSVPFILRSPIADDTLGGYRVRAGSTVVIAPWVTHRHPAFWKEPEEFRPERFSEGVKGLPHRLAFLPFGAGQRICLGEFMGQVEGKMILTKLLQRYDLTLAPGFEPECRGFISLQPVNGMKMHFVRREIAPRSVAPQAGELRDSKLANVAPAE
ncbi:MAG TPA: cytochrome P450 [Polyangiaceae bacterium]|nr:cytochrome P450 [Polyangiaceae bacterium]